MMVGFFDTQKHLPCHEIGIQNLESAQEYDPIIPLSRWTPKCQGTTTNL